MSLHIRHRVTTRSDVVGLYLLGFVLAWTCGAWLITDVWTRNGELFPHRRLALGLLVLLGSAIVWSLRDDTTSKLERYRWLVLSAVGLVLALGAAAIRSALGGEDAFLEGPRRSMTSFDLRAVCYAELTVCWIALAGFFFEWRRNARPGVSWLDQKSNQDALGAGDRT